MTNPRILLLAGYTARAQAYAQALTIAGIKPALVLMYGNSELDVARKAHVPSGHHFESVHLPDLSETLRETCSQNRWNTAEVPATSVNDPTLRKAIDEFRPDLVIYAGYGGQIVESELLGLGYPMLHCHPGWLPNYRGSTTIYYSILQEHECAVTVFLMDSAIDTGKYIFRKRYPLPKNTLVDELYDNAIRADALIEALLKNQAEFTRPKNQTESGTTYYEIHPVLKHIALLSIETGTKS